MKIGFMTVVDLLFTNLPIKVLMKVKGILIYSEFSSSEASASLLSLLESLLLTVAFLPALLFLFFFPFVAALSALSV